MTTGTAELAARALSYEAVGATGPESPPWTAPAGYRSYEKTVRVGAGEACWEAAAAAVSSWGVKTRGGFAVSPAAPSGGVQVGERYWLLARLGPVVVREPVQVVAAVDEGDRRGFAYGTLSGHPVSGEEAFIVHRSADGAVWLTLRSLTARAMTGPGGHRGAATESSATGSHPHTGSSDKSLPGPAKTEPRTALPAAS